MRADPQPVLFDGPYCGNCPLCCPEKNTDAACDETGAARFAVSPAVPDVFEAFFRWSPRPAAPGLPMPVGEVPAYMPILPREAVPLALDRVRGPLVFTLRDFLTLTRRAERLEIELRVLLGTRGRRIVVLGADPDRFVLRCWQRWPLVRARILRHRPDLIVGPDLGFYDDDKPASRTLFFYAHTCMYRDLVGAGIAAVPPIGWTLASDLDRFASWAKEFDVPGAFLDLQRRTSPGPFEEVVEDLRRFRRRFPAGFLWLVNGLQSRERWEELRRVLENVRFTSSGAWHESRNGSVLDPDLGPVPTQAERLDAFAESVSRLTRAATDVTAPSREPLRALAVRQLELFEPLRSAVGL